MPAKTEVRYCYQCGQRVTLNPLRACWYCGAPTDRRLRPMCRCPFCDEEVSPHAVKCPHCREYLDGRPAPSSSHITYMIDKAVIHGGQPVTLQGGEPVPPAFRAHLTERTAAAIEANDPARIDQEGVRALPAPEGRADAPQPMPLIRADAREIAPITSPARSHTPAPPPPQKLKVTTENQETPDNQAPEFHNCAYCRTECLASDSFCFHCGAVLREEAVAAIDKWHRSHRKSNLWLLLGTLILLAIILFVAPHATSFPTNQPLYNVLALLVAAAFAPLLLTIAFFRIRTTLNQFFALVLILLWAVTLVVSAPPLWRALSPPPHTPAAHAQTPPAATNNP